MTTSLFDCNIFLITAIRLIRNRSGYTALLKQSVNVNHDVLSVLKAKMSENLLNRFSFHTIIKNLTFYFISMYRFLILGGNLGGDLRGTPQVESVIWNLIVPFLFSFAFPDFFELLSLLPPDTISVLRERFLFLLAVSRPDAAPCIPQEACRTFQMLS